MPPAIDRISDLPDCLLSHILSFLPTPTAARTSLLSSRWKPLFASNPALDLQDRRPFSFVSKIIAGRKFIDFVDTALALRSKSHLSKFRLRCLANYDARYLDSWIVAAAAHPLQELRLSIPSSVSLWYATPRELFSCQSLGFLQLEGNFDVGVPPGASFPRLKTLRLAGAALRGDGLRRLLSACPALEESRVSNCYLCKGERVFVASSSVKRLDIGPLFDVEDNCELRDYEFVLDTPRLEYLTLDLISAKSYGCGNLDCVVKAYCFFPMPIGRKMPDLSRLLVGLHKVKSLSLLIYNKDLSRYCPPSFPNLTYLKLEVAYGLRMELMQSMLGCCPNLRVLSILMELGIYDGDCFREPVPSCLSLHLKKVELEPFSGMETELNLVKSFLSYAEVLEVVIIRFLRDLPQENKSSVFNKVLLFPKVSNICKIYSETVNY